MDSSFDLAALYADFEEAKKANDWGAMRAVVSVLKKQRMKMKISQAEEREWREDPF